MSDAIHLEDGEVRELDVAALEQDLAALWQAAAGQERKGGAVSRACQSTVAIPLGPGHDATDLLDDLARLHPSRAIVARIDPELAPGDVRAWVSATCNRRSVGSALVCAEIIHLEAGPGSDARITSAVRSLAVGGVPLLVLADQVSPLDVPWVEGVGSFADRILADSVGLDVASGLAVWERVLAGASATSSTSSYRDLLWTRLVDWRRALALWFDRPGEAERLEIVTRVRLVVDTSPAGLLKGWLLLGWLASRLGWEVTSGAAAFESPQGPVPFEITQTPCGEDTHLQSIELEFGNGPRLEWARKTEAGAIVVLVGDDPNPRFRLNQQKTSRASAVAAEIHQHAPDEVARASLAMALRLGRGAGS